MSALFDDPAFVLAYDRAADAWCEAMGQEHLRRVEALTPQCESPIEAMLACYLAALRTAGLDVLIFTKNWPRDNEERDRARRTGALCIEAQAAIDLWRVDFLLTLIDIDGEMQHVVIECDGHEFHERTKEQAARDRARDRAMIAKGYHVLRFTGSEIHRNGPKCLGEIESFLFDLHMGVKGVVNG